MPGFLIPDNYVVVAPTEDDMLVASIIWGFTLATGMFAGNKAYKQTSAQWKRSRAIKPYSYMIWAEWLVSMVIGVLSWLFLKGTIEARFVQYRRPVDWHGKKANLATLKLLDLLHIPYEKPTHEDGG